MKKTILLPLLLLLITSCQETPIEVTIITDFEMRLLNQTPRSTPNKFRVKVSNVVLVDSITVLDSIAYWDNLFRDKHNLPPQKKENDDYTDLINLYNLNFKSFDTLVSVYKDINDSWGKEKTREYRAKRNAYLAARDEVVYFKKQRDNYEKSLRTTLVYIYEGDCFFPTTPQREHSISIRKRYTLDAYTNKVIDHRTLSLGAK